MSGRGSCVMTEQGRQAEGAILGLLLNFEAGSLWSVEELVRQLSAPRLDVMDGLASLQAAGLVHRVEDFVFATRAASSFDQLEL
jgi:DNA-binding IclR family transcriptional regulator